MARGVGATTWTSADAWIDPLREAGYVVVSSLLHPREVDELRETFPPETPGSTLHVEVDDQTPYVERWRSLAGHRAIRTLLADALGDYTVRLHGRDPGRGAGAQGLHADRPPGRVHNFDAITLLWMLDEFKPANGATRVVPLSHRSASAVPRRLAQPGMKHPDERIITGHPGDVLIFDAHLWHSGQENSSGVRRRAVQMTATRSSLSSGRVPPGEGGGR